MHRETILTVLAVIVAATICEAKEIQRGNDGVRIIVKRHTSEAGKVEPDQSRIARGIGSAAEIQGQTAWGIGSKDQVGIDDQGTRKVARGIGQQSQAQSQSQQGRKAKKGKKNSKDDDLGSMK